MLKYIFTGICTVAVLSACVEDEGTYNNMTGANTLNAITVKNIEEAYDGGLAFIDTLRISPKVKGSLYEDNEDNYEYAWYRCYSEHTHDTLSTERELVCKLDFSPGTHNLYFVVKDKYTKLEKITLAKVKVSSPFQRGFLLAGNRPGDRKAALDMLTMPRRGNTVDTAYVKNALDPEELDAAGVRDFLYTGYYDPQYERFFMMTESGDYQLRYEDDMFKVNGEFNQLGITEPSLDFTSPQRLMDVGMRQGAYQMAGGATAYRFYMTGEFIFSAMPKSQVDYMTVPLNRYFDGSAETFSFYPKFFYNTRKRNYSFYVSSSATPMFYYDLDNQCLSYRNSLNNYSTVLSDKAGSGVTVNNRARGLHLIYGENDFASPNGRCNLLLANADESKFTLCQFAATFAVTSSAPLVNGTERVFDTSTATEFDKAEKYHFSSYASQVAYSVGSKLYVYDYVTKRVAVRDMGAKITCLVHAVLPAGTTNNEYWVGTFDGTKGMIYKMYFDADQNATNINQMPGQAWEVDMEPVQIVFSYRGARN